jgi:hypothetical protein
VDRITWHGAPDRSSARCTQAAARRAGVEPGFEQRDIPDPVAFILTKNVQRRNLTKSQTAMAVAYAYPDAEKGGRGRKASQNEGFESVSAGYLSQARLVLAKTPDAAAMVLAGRRALNDAYADAVQIKGRELSVENRLELPRGPHRPGSRAARGWTWGYLEREPVAAPRQMWFLMQASKPDRLTPRPAFGEV